MVRKMFGRVARVALGLGFLGFGVVGLFLPLLPGILFLLIGLTLLSSDSAGVHQMLGRMRGAVRRALRRSVPSMQLEGVSNAG